MVQEGAAMLVEDDQLKTTLANLINELINDQQRLKVMNKAALKLARPNAATHIAKEIIALAQSDLISDTNE